MKKYQVIEKSVGETPLQAIEKFRSEHNIQEDTPLAYAGRLDPMASGKLLVLIGEECKKQKKYHNLDKAYDFEILLNIESDTGDVLGIPQYKRSEIPKIHQIKNLNLRGPITMEYPHYSSKTVGGKPLFLWTLENKLHEIEIPTITTNIYTLRYKGMRTTSKSELVETVLAKIGSIPPVEELSKQLGADFRREEITSAWQNLLNDNSTEQQFVILSFSVICSSGTYIRSLAPLIAEKYKGTGLAYSIHRTKIGKYSNLFAGIGFWKRLY